MSAQDRRYLILLNPGAVADEAALAAIRSQFFDWLKRTGAEVVQDGGANRLVISSAPETAELVRGLDYVVAVEPYA